MGVLPIGLAPEESTAAIAERKPQSVITFRRHGIRAIAWLLLAAITGLIPGYAPDFTGSASMVLVFVLLGTGLSLEIGLAAVPDFGITGYFAAGAYCAAVLSRQTAWPFWACLPLCGLVGTALALAVAKPLVRRSAPVFAIVTLAFSAIVQIVLTTWNGVTGGPAGLRLPPISHRELYYNILLAIVLFAGVVAWRLRCMPIALALRAAHDDEIGCRGIGINPAALKLSVIAIAGAMAGLAGAFYAAALGTVRPPAFDLSTMATLFALVLLGGTRTQLRLCIAALLVVGLPFAVPFIAEYRLLIFGIGIALWPLVQHCVALRLDSAERSLPIFTRLEPRAE